ncbi:histone deacetylase complex subunit SAP30 homolog [Anthonomus grandis grandis]|uniref:histone deacetylase complex subunit SAP30 homolog n=1 Tax=Anthonomus grandis grandis TaxID=2921223 RepID=UPI0021665734|nr:histone deacetylase complex subunit SAP30 homolog [Anthonomus grandis grandis]
MNGFSTGEEDSRGPTDQICCLIDNGERCANAAGNASYSKRIQKTVTQRRLNLLLDTKARHIYICELHKMIIQTARTSRRRKDSEESEPETPEVPDIDFNSLPVNTLRRYKKYYNIQTRPGLNKAQLAEVLTKHFRTIPVKEKDVLSYFIYTVKTNSNKLDQKNGTTTENA